MKRPVVVYVGVMVLLLMAALAFYDALALRFPEGTPLFVVVWPWVVVSLLFFNALAPLWWLRIARWPASFVFGVFIAVYVRVDVHQIIKMSGQHGYQFRISLAVFIITLVIPLSMAWLIYAFLFGQKVRKFLQHQADSKSAD